MEDPSFKTSSGIEVQRYYGPDAGPPPAEERPGEYPFTRGVHATMYRGKPWTMRQYAGFGTAAQTNARFRWLLEQGQTGLSTAFDLPTQIGLDADHPRAAGEVGRVGVHIGHVGEMSALFEGVPLEEVSTSLTINASAAVLLAFYVVVAERRGLDPAVLRGTLQNDILKEFLARGTYIFPPGPSVRLAADTIEYALKKLPKFNPISISGYHIREAGSDAVQEIAFTFGNAEVYLKELRRRGLTADSVGRGLSFFFGCHNHFLEEVAKFRAARGVWARIMKEDWGASDPRAQALRFHVQTCGSTLTSRQPHNNVVRVALQAMAAVLGGAQSLHTNAFDEALSLPTEDSAGLALRTQQILACETGVADAADPVGGAWTVEALTGELAGRILGKVKSIRERGGMLSLIEQGLPQAEIQESAYRDQLAVETGRRKIVGVNCHQAEGESRRGPKPRVHRPSRGLEAEQIKSLRRTKSGRDKSAVKTRLAELEDAARSPSENLFPRLLDGARAGATLGELCGVLRDVFGEHTGGG